MVLCTEYIFGSVVRLTQTISQYTRSNPDTCQLCLRIHRFAGFVLKDYFMGTAYFNIKEMPPAPALPSGHVVRYYRHDPLPNVGPDYYYCIRAPALPHMCDSPALMKHLNLRRSAGSYKARMIRLSGPPSFRKWAWVTRHRIHHTITKKSIMLVS